jgi:hypothetical protein
MGIWSSVAASVEAEGHNDWEPVIMAARLKENIIKSEKKGEIARRRDQTGEKVTWRSTGRRRENAVARDSMARWRPPGS